MLRITILFLAIICSLEAFAQEPVPQTPPPSQDPQATTLTHKLTKGFYLRANLGYMLPHAGSTLGTEVTFVSDSNFRYQNIDGSLGKGIRIEGAAGYMFNNHVGVDLSVLYNFGLNYTIPRVSTFKRIPDNAPDETTYRGSMFAITPSAILSGGLHHKFVPFLKLGLIVALPSYTIIENSPVAQREIKTNYTGGMALGFAGGLGVEYNINNKFGIYGEIKLNSLSYTPSESEIVNYEVNGKNELSTLKTEDINKILVDYITTKKASGNEALANSKPFSSIGFNFGVKYKFYK